MSPLSPEVIDLLLSLVARLDAAEARGASRAQSIVINESTWPAFRKVPFESEKEVLWAEVRQMHAKGWIQLKPESAAKSVSGYAQEPRVRVTDAAAVRAAVGRLQRTKSSAERWKEAINEHLQASEEVKALVGGFASSFQAVACRRWSSV